MAIRSRATSTRTDNIYYIFSSPVKPNNRVIRKALEHAGLPGPSLPSTLIIIIQLNVTDLPRPSMLSADVLLLTLISTWVFVITPKLRGGLLQ